MTVIKIKNSNVSGRLPASGDIEIAELALNIADQKLYSKDAAGAIFEIGVAGDIPSGIAPPSSGNNNGDLYFDTSTARLLYWDGSGWQTVVKASGDNFTGDVTLGTDKITLDATAGSATFAGSVVSDVGLWCIRAQGQAYLAGSSTDAFSATDAGGGTNTVKIGYDGSASFAGGASVEGGSEIRVGSGSAAFVVKDGFGSGIYAGSAINLRDTSNNLTVSIASETGNATFAGDVNVGDNKIFGSWGITIDSGTADSGEALTVINNSASTATIGQDGSATFANSTAGAYTFISHKPAATAFCISGGGTNDVSAPTWNITPSGAATFPTVNGASVLINLEADDDTKYTSTTDSEGNETRVYNGEVLDVKDRLTKADNALKALKTAAAAATTIADLKNAIATALADV